MGLNDLKIITIVGARPQFVKAAAVSRAIARWNESSTQRIDERIVHTGQHYDQNMSKVFFDELEIPLPAMNLEVGSGSHAAQTGSMLVKIEQILQEENPDWVLVYGDTNSTLAGALAAAKLQVPVAHVEAGLRSFNRRMPEEINRILADRVSSLLLCPTRTAVENLTREHIAGAVHQVGDVMYDSVLFNTQLARKKSRILQTLSLAAKSYYLATIHRAENTDDPARLAGIIEGLSRLDRPIVLPLHPRTRKTLGAGLANMGPRMRVIDPVPYLDMLTLESNAYMVLTDSGGVQKEAYWFRVPCVTLRDQTEWVELVEIGCNRVVGADASAIVAAVEAFISAGELPFGRQTDLYGDGRSAESIVKILAGQIQPHQ